MPDTRPDVPHTDRKAKWIAPTVIVGTVVIGVSGLYLYDARLRSPRTGECEDAIRNRYEKQGWGIEPRYGDIGERDKRVKLHVSLEDSIAACVEKASLKTVQCLTDAKTVTELEQCDGYEQMHWDHWIEGLYCYDLTNHRSGLVTTGRCSFQLQECEGWRDYISAHTSGWTLDECTSRKTLYGIKSSEKKGWYGVTATIAECKDFWAKSSGELTNVVPGCRKIGPGARDLGAVGLVETLEEQARGPRKSDFAPEGVKVKKECLENPLAKGCS